MPTDIAAILKDRPAGGAQPAQVLALVAATVPLPKAMSAALRLVSHVTKLTVDQGITELDISSASAESLRAVSNPLTSGLASLRLSVANKNDIFLLSTVIAVAYHNFEHLESLNLELSEDLLVENDATVTLAMLGACDWPQLRSLTIFSFPGIFSTAFLIHSMPCLAVLHLRGAVDASDVAALSTSACFTSTIEDLEIKPNPYSINQHAEVVKYFNTMLESTPRRLRRLALSVGGCRDLSFLSNAELPSLEILQLIDLPHDASLECITLVARPKLRTLRLIKLTPMAPPGMPDDTLSDTASLQPLFSGRSGPPSALLDLHLSGFDFSTFGLIIESGLTGLTSLELRGYGLAANLGHVAAALAHLPALEALQLLPYSMMAETAPKAEDLMKKLLEAAAFPRLRRLETGGDWVDNDKSFGVLISFAESLSQLEEIVLSSGCISPEIISALAEAGRRGRWPHLKRFEVQQLVGPQAGFEDKNESFCAALLHEVWSGLEVTVVGDPDPDLWIKNVWESNRSSRILMADMYAIIDSNPELRARFDR